MIGHRLGGETTFRRLNQRQHEAHGSHRLRAGPVDQKAVYRMSVERITFQSVGKSGRVLELRFQAIDPKPYGVRLLQQGWRVGKCSLEIEIEALEQVYPWALAKLLGGCEGLFGHDTPTLKLV